MCHFDTLPNEPQNIVLPQITLSLGENLMAVLVEALSVIIKRDAIDSNFRRGWDEFLSIIPNSTFCTDGSLVRVGFMTPDDVGRFIETLEDNGLMIATEKGWCDVAVVDQDTGPTLNAPWLQFARMDLGKTGNKVSACWLRPPGPNVGAGTYIPSLSASLATPEGWEYESSLSSKLNRKFVATEHLNAAIKLLRREEDQDVYLDLATGKECFVARARPGNGH